MVPAIRGESSLLSQRLIAAAVVLGFLYVASSLVMTIVISLLLALILEPTVGLLTRRGLPRSLSALVTVLLMLAATYICFYFFFAQAQSFVSDFPKYSGTLRRHVLRVRQKAVEIQEKTQKVFSSEETAAPEPGGNRPAPDSSWSSYLGAGLRSATEVLVLVSFVPFLVYFLLAWKTHLRRTTITLFSGENRLAAERTLDGITEMIHGFVVGNAIIGLLLSVATGLFFWAIGLPYALFLGLISGFLSLVPYFGLVLALAPPLLVGLTRLTTLGPLVAIALAVILFHLVALNVLYPKIVGRRVQLNPVVVTLAIMFWGWLWGGLGLLLAVPITAAMKAICDNVGSLRPYGRLMGY